MRIDFALAPLQTEMFTDSLLMIEDGRSFHGELLQLCNAIAEISLNVAVNRVACVVQFGSEAPDLETANKLIMSALPNRYRIALSNEADFILQINHLQTSGIVDKLQLNLINKWAVERARIITMGTSIGQPAIKELLVATVLFDHNNNPESGVLTADEQSRLLVEAFQSMSNSLRDCNLIIEGF